MVSTRGMFAQTPFPGRHPIPSPHEMATVAAGTRATRMHLCLEFYHSVLCCMLSVTEEEFQTLAEDLRPHMEQAMKIEVAPWIREYVTDMENLYSELTLEKLDNKPFGSGSKKLDTYKELFVNPGTSGFRSDTNVQQKKIPRKTVLFKGDPGIGKTTLVKKVTFDWAKGIFTAVSIVFFVFLKLVNPGDTIENVIIDQTPVLEGLNITGSKMKTILETFGPRCLLILDGIDEHALGQNQAGWPRHRENRENREFGSYFFQTGKTQGILL